VLVRHRPHGGAGEDGGDGAALVEDDPHEPGEEAGRALAADDARAGPLGEGERPAGPRPETDQPAQRPEVDEQDGGVGGAADRRDQEGLDDVDLPAHQPADQDAEQERGDHLAGQEDEQQGGDRGEQAPEPDVPALVRRLARGEHPDEEEEGEQPARAQPAPDGARVGGQRLRRQVDRVVLRGALRAPVRARSGRMGRRYRASPASASSSTSACCTERCACPSWSTHHSVSACASPLRPPAPIVTAGTPRENGTFALVEPLP
jgi:hypothetical protein